MSDAPKVIWAAGDEITPEWEGIWHVDASVEGGTKYHHDDTVTALEAERDQALAREAALKDNNQHCRELQLEVNSLKSQLQDQALSHLAAMGQYYDQITSPAHATKVDVMEKALKRIAKCKDIDGGDGAHSTMEAVIAATALRAIAELEGGA